MLCQALDVDTYIVHFPVRPACRQAGFGGFEMKNIGRPSDRDFPGVAWRMWGSVPSWAGLEKVKHDMEDEVSTEAEEYNHLRKDEEDCQIVRELIERFLFHVFLLVS